MPEETHLATAGPDLDDKILNLGLMPQLEETWGRA